MIARRRTSLALVRRILNRRTGQKPVKLINRLTSQTLVYRSMNFEPKLRTQLGSGTIEDLFILRDHFSEIAEQRKKRKYTKKDFIYWKKDSTM